MEQLGEQEAAHERLGSRCTRRRSPLRLCVPHRAGVNEETRARTKCKCSCEYERGSSHYRVTGACCAFRVGFGALVVTLSTAAWFLADVATGGFARILGAAGASSATGASATGASMVSTCSVVSSTVSSAGTDSVIVTVVSVSVVVVVMIPQEPSSTATFGRVTMTPVQADIDCLCLWRDRLVGLCSDPRSRRPGSQALDSSSPSSGSGSSLRGFAFPCSHSSCPGGDGGFPLPATATPETTKPSTPIRMARANGPRQLLLHLIPSPVASRFFP